MQSYDYVNHQGIEEISWDRFASLAAVLAEHLTGVVVCTLRRELYPVRVTRRVNDQVTHRHPVWKVDEITDTGETLALVAELVKISSAKQVVTASLVSHRCVGYLPLRQASLYRWALAVNSNRHSGCKVKVMTTKIYDVGKLQK
jgi:hypoxanthine phosphoribosyltransferase